MYRVAGASVAAAVNIGYFIAVLAARPYTPVVRSLRGCGGAKGWADLLNAGDAALSAVCAGALVCVCACLCVLVCLCACDMINVM